MFVNW